MRRLAILGVCGLLAACGAEGDPLQPNVGLGLGIGPGGIKVRPNVSVNDGTARVSAGAGGVRVGASEGPVSVSAGL